MTCPSCGAEVLEVQGHSPYPATAAPCGHQVRVIRNGDQVELDRAL